MVEYTRQPCPIRVVEDCGCAFLMGAIGGTMFQYMRGFRNAPAGLVRGLYGGLDSVKMRTPAMAGNFAVWGATFSSVDCTLVYMRQQEDTWNSIISGAATGGILAARNGIKAMGNGALVGGLVLALIEGAGAAVATIYAAQPANGEHANNPIRPEWELFSVAPSVNEENSRSANDALAEIERVVEKCNSNNNSSRRSTRVSMLGRKTNPVESIQNGSQDYAKPPPSLLELVKLANFF
ncbi:probable mitochondrial import inner membrane translocase subunit Tim17 3 [Drosophila innubila]|uniref:probable mitochondrial import inner membrane translocase subunit Tim17 3 n=1 Tax=Drosophila innubila TaxID=198719 RepID=UPI00148E8FA6|nr:probable mitochondrial import inner membrane translocase subunit Tim17 3 [Drosophila innubila]